jgi:serine/threonine-protein phosphatase 2A activator
MGMMKMYLAEVLEKRVVVQHTPLGGIISWDEVEDAEKRGPDTLGMGAKIPTLSRRSAQIGSMGPPPPVIASRRMPPLGIPTPTLGPATTHARPTEISTIHSPPE